ncbi:MAG: ABC transporter substrate-binding protein [bacterium]
MRRRFLCLSICVALFVSLSCGDRDRSEEEAAVSSDRVPEFRVGHVGHDHHLALYVAALEGEALDSHCGAFLKEIKETEVYDLIVSGEHLARLRFVKVGGGSRMPAAMERGEIDMGLGGVAPVIFFIDKGNPFKIIFPLQTDGDMLVMRPDFPATDWSSFVSYIHDTETVLKIGYKAPVAVAKLIFERALQAESIPIAHQSEGVSGKVELVNLQDEANMVPSLLSGAVDGFVVNQPHASVAVHKGAGKIICDLSALPPDGKWKQHPCCCVASSESMIASHREVLKGFLKVLCGATDLIHSDQSLAVRDAATWTKFPEDVEADSVPSVNYINAPSPEWLAGMRTWAEMMGEIGKFSGSLKGKSPQDVLELVAICQLSRRSFQRIRCRWGTDISTR